MASSWGAIFFLVLALLVASAIGYGTGLLLDTQTSLDLHWTEYFKAIGPTVIGLGVLYVAWQQWLVNQASLKEKLFDRRMAIVTETQSLLGQARQFRRLSEADVREFEKSVQLSRFLFSRQLHAYLEEVQKRITNVVTAETGKKWGQTRELSAAAMAITIKPNSLKGRSELQVLDDLEYLEHSFKNLASKFEGYLSFSN